MQIIHSFVVHNTLDSFVVFVVVAMQDDVLEHIVIIAFGLAWLVPFALCLLPFLFGVLRLSCPSARSLILYVRTYVRNV